MPDTSACQASDLTHGTSAIVLWCLPTAALVVGAGWPPLQAWLWVPAFSIMGVACVVNGVRCGRLHCYLTGPLFLFAAAAVALGQAHIVPRHPALLLDAVAGATLLSFALEYAVGRYRRVG